MDARLQSSDPAVVVTSDLELLDQILAVAAAAGVAPLVVADARAVRPAWAGASMVVVGADQAAQLAKMVLPRRSETYVVGSDGDRDPVFTWSGPLGAAVVLLPSCASWFTTAMVDACGLGAGTGRLVVTVGGSGGVGASTFAAALAFVGARRGLRTLLVDADPRGGGIDLLVAAERTPGWRWPRLATARGHLGDLTGHLPQVDGVDVLSVERGHDPDLGPDGEQMKAVVQSATRSHDLIVVDAPRELTPASREAVRRADLVLLIALAQLRGVAAAQQMLRQLEDSCRVLRLVVRTTRPRSLTVDTVEDGLALPLVGSITEDPSVRLGTEHGDPPGRGARSQLARACRPILDGLFEAGNAA